MLKQSKIIIIGIKNINIFWFRQDLRIMDNPGLYHACLDGKVTPIYILDNTNNHQQLGGASKVWLYESLKKLNEKLKNKMLFFSGDPEEIIKDIIIKHKPKEFYWNRMYDQWSIGRDKKIKSLLLKNNINVNTYNASMLVEPWKSLKDDDTPYKVFTPFYRKTYLSNEFDIKLYKSPNLDNLIELNNSKFLLDSLNLMTDHKWVQKLLKQWSIGEEEAHKKLKKFLKTKAENYKEGRNYPAHNKVSFLSPHIHFGEISPKYIWIETSKNTMNNDLAHFLSELGWREFSYYLLYHFPNLPNENLQKKFNRFPWNNNKKLLNLWKKGLTGYPIVDAGMRELYQTGYMNNRVRMIVASFLVKNLLIHWNEGQKWFWECLFDADLANNSASWQWVAGSGADAAPYFRIFNPVLQAKKFDPDGKYIKKFVPELKNLENKYLFAPWEVDDKILKSRNIILGSNYPKPIVDLKESRNIALKAFETLV